MHWAVCVCVCVSSLAVTPPGIRGSTWHLLNEVVWVWNLCVCLAVLLLAPVQLTLLGVKVTGAKVPPVTAERALWISVSHLSKWVCLTETSNHSTKKSTVQTFYCVNYIQRTQPILKKNWEIPQGCTELSIYRNYLFLCGIVRINNQYWAKQWRYISQKHIQTV